MRDKRSRVDSVKGGRKLPAGHISARPEAASTGHAPLSRITPVVFVAGHDRLERRLVRARLERARAATVLSNLSESPARGSLSGGGDARSLSEAEEGYGRVDFGDSSSARCPACRYSPRGHRPRIPTRCAFSSPELGESATLGTHVRVHCRRCESTP